MITSGVSQVIYNLCHVIEDGKIVHRGEWCQHVITGIDEVVDDKAVRHIDAHYYDLTGRAVGSEMPTKPGIYIHRGKKIVVR